MPNHHLIPNYFHLKLKTLQCQRKITLKTLYMLAYVTQILISFWLHQETLMVTSKYQVELLYSPVMAGSVPIQPSRLECGYYSNKNKMIFLFTLNYEISYVIKNLCHFYNSCGNFSGYWFFSVLHKSLKMYLKLQKLKPVYKNISKNRDPPNKWKRNHHMFIARNCKHKNEYFNYSKASCFQII